MEVLSQGRNRIVTDKRLVHEPQDQIATVDEQQVDKE